MLNGLTTFKVVRVMVAEALGYLMRYLFDTLRAKVV